MVNSNTAGILVAVATLVTSLGATFGVVYNAIRTKRVESKIDNGAVVQEQIHTAVNSNLSNALAKIELIGQELHAARVEIAELKQEITDLKSPPSQP